jgi:hypothetical protein
MSQIHLIDELSETLRIGFRKEKRPGFFPLVTSAFESIDFAFLDSLGYLVPNNASMYSTDEAGNIRYLFCEGMNLAAARVIRQMEQLEFLFLSWMEPWAQMKPKHYPRFRILNTLLSLWRRMKTWYCPISVV